MAKVKKPETKKKIVEQMPQITNKRQFKKPEPKQENLKTFNPDLIGQAHQVGFSDEQIKVFKDEDSLIKAVSQLSPQFAAVASQNKRQFNQKPQEKLSVETPPIEISKPPKDVKTLSFNIETDQHHLQSINRAARDESAIQSRYRAENIATINVLTINIKRHYQLRRNDRGYLAYITEVTIEYF